MHDYHAHSNYSDGELFFRMIGAASEAGLDGIGFADHCNVSEREAMQSYKRELGFNLDQTHERRREAISRLRDRYDLRIYDAVEMDYDPKDEDAIADFLAETPFDYAIGSVHHLEDVNVHFEAYFAEKSEAELNDLADRYVEKLRALIESELFEIAAHVDILERNPVLRGRLTEDHYRQIADAFEDSRTIPELNAGRVLEEYGQYHPTPALYEALRDRGVAMTIGTDAHSPERLRNSVETVEATLAERGLEPTELDV